MAPNTRMRATARRAAAALVLGVGVALRPVLFLVYHASGWSPRDPRRWVFGSWSGHRFSDNSAALFRHVAGDRDAAVEVTWISRELRIVRELRGAGFRAHTRWSPAGLLACLRAGVFVFDGLTKDVNHWLSRGAKRVLLRHGVGIKKIERAIDNPRHRLYQLFHGNALQRIWWRALIPWHTVRPDLVIATSGDHARQAELYFGVGAERIAITGFPRNDRLLRGERSRLAGDLRRWLDECARLGRPVFLYLPTFRDDVRRLPIEWRELDAVAGRAGVRILVKLHYVDASRGLDRGAGGHAELMLADARLDPIDLYAEVDGLISDFSSAVYDFILTGKPVVFYVPDRDRFLRSRSLYYEFDEVAPGPKASDAEELERALATTAANGRGEWSEQYGRVLARFHERLDASSSDRTFREIRRRFVATAGDNGDVPAS